MSFGNRPELEQGTTTWKTTLVACAPTLLVAAYAVLAVAWALLVPPFEKPDEIAHFAYVQQIAAKGKLPVQGVGPGGDAAVTEWQNSFLEAEAQQPPLYYVLAALPYRAANASGLAKTDLDEWGRRINPRGPIDRRTMTQPVFWLHRDGTYAHDVTVLRLFSLVLGCLTVAAVWRLAVLVLVDAGPALAAAALVAFLPQFTFLSTSVTNDTLAWLYGAVYVLALLTMVRAPSRKRDFLLLGVLTGLGAYTKATVWTLWPLALVAIYCSASRARNLAVWVTSSVAVGGWWFARNWILYHDLIARQERINPGFFAWNMAPRAITDAYFRGPFWRATFESFVAYFGFQSVRVHHTLTAAAACAVVIAAAGLLAEAASIRRRPSTTAAATAAVLVGSVALAASALVYYNLSVGQPQGRYLFHVLGPLAVLTVIGWRRVLAWPRGPLTVQTVIGRRRVLAWPRGLRWPGLRPIAWWPYGVVALALVVNLYCLGRVIVPAYDGVEAAADYSVVQPLHSHATLP